MKEPENIKDMILLTLEGKHDAFFDIYNATVNDVAKIVHNLIYDKSQKDDIIQDIYIEMYKALSKFKIDQPFTPWLIGIVVRQTKSHLRKNWLLFRLKNKQMEQADQESQPDFSGKLVDQLDNRELLQSIHGLSYKLKTVIVLRYLSDYSQEEIAQILNIPIGTVRSRISYALKVLRTSIKKEHMSQMEVERYEF
ncbi:sigma-70 family RNA polymerase sigma factor [Paenibacillus chitinolyticus]|uniref:sigma-70 family RNA polymerase sigma factor n=1 Tax=Paenibacillus chitinolyticus TaxID=79263 RepID=UPI002DB83560|nr:sigma-70 family RNA polymerase sigma factor [Paenibacillus chitinolyticus]MEC0246545.1 sigma-70 family RNA polymerase sigma factor [Paenibacillus chitinolyticus]